MIFHLFLFCCFGFALGYLAKVYITTATEALYVINECPKCQVKCYLPKYTRWDYTHDCTHRHCDTTIHRRDIADLIEPREKAPGEGKTLC